MEIVRTIATLARNLGMEVVAEGVESEDQLACLNALNCEYAQGYLFSQALTAEAASRFIESDQERRQEMAAGTLTSLFTVIQRTRWSLLPNAQVPSPKSQVPSPKSQVSSPKSQVSSLKSQVSSPKSQVSSLESQVSSPKSWCLGLGTWESGLPSCSMTPQSHPELR